MNNRKLDQNNRQSINETGLVRELADRIRGIAQEPRMTQVIQRWQDVNDLRKPDRAPVWCKPIGCWQELLPETSLLCRQPLHRKMEQTFRRQLIKYEIGDDEIIHDYWRIGPVIRAEPANWWGVETGKHSSNEKGGAWAYDPPVKTPEDFDLLARPEFTFDLDATSELARQSEEILGDTMPVKIMIAPDFDHATMVCSQYAYLRGLENLMLDTVLEPEFAHRLYRHITDAQLRWLDTLENAGLNATNCDQPMLCSRPFGPPPENGRYALANCWCAGNSQEFDQVSPQDFAVFLLPYQQEIFRRFGRISYGCCENLTQKMDLIIDQVPNLRLLTCSAWTDFNRLVDKVGDQYAVMWRQKATDVVFAKTVEELRPAMMEQCNRLQNSFYQVVLRELQTLNGDLRRLHDWTKLALECVETYAG